jgi:hypothetical protein
MSILKQAREILSNPDHWTKGCNARDRYGHSCASAGGEACKWCAHGALCKLTPADTQEEKQKACDIRNKAMGYLRKVSESRGFISFTYYNDEVATHSDILSLFDEAIRLEDADGQ